MRARICYVAVAIAVFGCKKRPERLVPETEIRHMKEKADAFLSAHDTGAWLRTPDHSACDKPVQKARPLPVPAALPTLLAGLRAVHKKIRRGSLIVAADMTNACKLLTDALSARLAAPELTSSDLTRARAALDALIKQYPTASVLVRDELYMTLLDRVLRVLQPPGWKPPKGWPGHVAPRTGGDEDDEVLHVFKYERDLYGLRWLAIRAELAAAAQVCGPTSSLQQCRDGLRGMAEAHEAHLEQVGKEDLSGVIRASGKTEVVRANAIDSMRETVRPDYETSLRDLAAGLARLVALRSKVAARLVKPGE